MLEPPFNTQSSVHTNCDSDDVGCRNKNVVESSYVTKHVPNCNCLSKDQEAFLRVDVSDLRRILEADGIPIVHLDTSESEPKLKVIAYRHEFQYTAISHV